MSGFGGDRRGFSSGAKPVEVGKEYDVQVTELSRRGDGVAKIEGFVIFVQGAKVGQKVKIKVDRVGPRFASATVVGHAMVRKHPARKSKCRSQNRPLDVPICRRPKRSSA